MKRMTGEATTQSLPNFLSGKSLLLPARLPTEQMVQQILARLESETGATFHPHFGEVSGQRLWAVAPYLERSRKTRDKARLPTRIRRFIEENEDLLDDPKHSLGVWYNTENGTYYLDIVVTVPDREEAVLMGQRGNQIAIYDLEAGQEIFTGGTGK